MAIWDEDEKGETITEGSRALELFTNRTEAVQRFCEYLNEDPPQKTFLFYYGEGGNGKSLLLRFLREHCCKRFADWEYVKTMGYPFLLHAQTNESTEQVPSALLDFGMQANGDDRPQESFPGLLMLRRALSGHNLGFPLFDFACTWHLHKTKRLSPERLASLFPAEEIGLAGEIADAITKTAYGALASAAFGIFGKHLREWFSLYRLRRKLEEADVERIQGLDESELIDELPALFAADLNTSMELNTAPKRVVLFFDTHEAFWGHERGLVGDPFFRRDEWFRCLLEVLEPKNGIVAVVAGQDLPRWSKAPKHSIPERKVEYGLIEYLSKESALEYLERAEIEDADIRRRICAYAEVAPGKVHPLFAGLCADIVISASKRSMRLTAEEFAGRPEAADKGAKLVERLLRCVDEGTRDGVIAVSACRAFDGDIYLKLADTLRFKATRQAFKELTRFSFVSPVEIRGDKWYRIHNLLRRLFHESGEELARQANEVLEKHYRQLSGPAATAEAIYHASRLEWKRGVKEWVQVFDSALEPGNYPLCRALLAVRGELEVRADFELGLLLRCEADFCKARARYDEANRQYLTALEWFDRARRQLEDDAEFHKSTAVLFINLGELQFERSHNRKSAESYQRAIDACDRAMSINAEDIEAYSLKAAALDSIGDLQSERSRSLQAIESYSAAISVCDQALQRVPDDLASGPQRKAALHALNDKAYAFDGIGEVEAKLSHHEEAIRNYQQALSCYDEALQRAGDDLVVQNNKAYGLVSVAESEAELSRFEPAIEKCKQAVTLYDEILRRAPEDIVVLSNKGRALRRAGRCLASLSRREEALEHYSLGLASCDEALRQAPADLWALNSKGLVLLSLGGLHAQAEEYTAASESYTQGLSTFESALTQASDDVEALTGRALVLFSVGEMLSKKAQRDEAIESYGQAVASFDQALEEASEDVEARKSKAYALQRLGELYLVLEKRETALTKLDDALKEFSRSIEIAPDDEGVREARDRLVALLNQLRIG